MAREFVGHPGLVVLSDNINIITALIGKRAENLILVGGSAGESDGTNIGEHAVRFISTRSSD